MIIEVTQQDIDKGIPGDCQNCAIGISIKRQTGLKYVDVDGVGDYKSARLVYNILKPSIDLPEECANFMKKYDNGEEVNPFKFELDYEL